MFHPRETESYLKNGAIHQALEIVDIF